MDALAYAGYLGRVDAILDTRGSALQSQDFAFGWQADFVAGIAPDQAVDDVLTGVVVYTPARAGHQKEAN